MLLVESYVKMKRFLPVSVLKGDNMYFDDLLETAQDDLVQNIIGEDILSVLKEKNEADNCLLVKCQRIISLDAFTKAIPQMDLILTESGFAVHSSEKMAPASKQRVEALSKSMAERLDNSMDSLIEYLLPSVTYIDWRNTSQFDIISSGLICTYKEFKRYGQYTPMNAERYPKSYADFAKLYPNMNTALTANVSPYLSPEYCSELIEKLKDKEIFSSQEKQVVEHLKYAIASFVLGDNKQGYDYIFSCLNFMKKQIELFPTYAASTEAQSLDNIHEDSPIFSLF